MQAMRCDAQQNGSSVQQCVGSGPVENMMALCGDMFVLPLDCIGSCFMKLIARRIENHRLAICANFATNIILESSVPLHMQTVSKAPASSQNNLTETTSLQLPGCKVPLGCKVHLPVVKCTFWL